MIIVTAGHVDHGKTSLVRHLTGVETDRLKDEQTRGLTIDLGFAYADLEDQRVGFVDVPGHIRFIHNMLAGVSGVQLALLVIAADDGPMPQTREHLAIIEALPSLADGCPYQSRSRRPRATRSLETGDRHPPFLNAICVSGHYRHLECFLRRNRTAPLNTLSICQRFAITKCTSI